MIKILNKKNDKIPVNSVYVGRHTKWGNPFIIGKDGTRQEVINKYRIYFYLSGLDIKELVGKNLVCWCAPLACHADFLLELAHDNG